MHYSLLNQCSPCAILFRENIALFLVLTQNILKEKSNDFIIYALVTQKSLWKGHVFDSMACSAQNLTVYASAHMPRGMDISLQSLLFLVFAFPLNLKILNCRKLKYTLALVPAFFFFCMLTYFNAQQNSALASFTDKYILGLNYHTSGFS
jgi:hypothetical protein